MSCVFKSISGQQNKQSAFTDTGAGETESAVWLGDTTEEPNTD